MSEKELNPDHYPAQRAATVVQHYINTLHGSPYKWFAVEEVQSATVQEIAERGSKYRVAFTVVEMVGNQPAGACSAEVLFPHGASQAPPEVQLTCGELLKIDTSTKEQAFYLKLKNNGSLVSAQDIPDSYGDVAPEMEPLWHLGRVASSFVMLKESNENTLYSMAQVASVTQQVSEGEQLLFSYHVLLHDRVSEEIFCWKIFVSWCPAEGVTALQMAAQTQ
ncbi:latexin-like [Megalops cyprinoides]|uniref:latexin-like n=1 Tax=Megalops cyprinoides TaxID=118141 RepID=UPI001863C42A|nr:latexin-like [Megalops cyprinoides]